MPGEILGIIGKNGAGKSSLLKILSKVTGPTTGSISYNGRIGSLLEVGTGFHPELTGRENIFLNGAILGMTKTEIRSKFDEIVDFSGVERYIDTPVKRYSSGMMVRLGFAVAAHLEPEILVIDEVLAVGDAEFQKKAIGKMQDVSKNDGRTVLFVSHNMAAVKNLCTRGIVLNNGGIEFIGDIDNCLHSYLKNEDFVSSKLLDGIKYKSNSIEVNHMLINNKEGNNIYVSNDKNTIEILIEGKVNLSTKFALEAKLYDDMERVVAIFSPAQLSGLVNQYKTGVFQIKENIVLPPMLTIGEFYLDIELMHPNVESYVTISKHIKLISQGITGGTGIEFKYSECGLIVL